MTQPIPDTFINKSYYIYHLKYIYLLIINEYNRNKK